MSSPPRHHQQQQQQQSPTQSVPSSPPKKRPTKSIQSILPDYLDAIVESSEHSEPSITQQSDTNSNVAPQPRTSSPTNDVVKSPSKHRRSKSPRKSSIDNSNSSSGSSNSRSPRKSSSNSPRRKVQSLLPVLTDDEEHETQEDVERTSSKTQRNDVVSQRKSSGIAKVPVVEEKNDNSKRRHNVTPTKNGDEDDHHHHHQNLDNSNHSEESDASFDLISEDNASETTPISSLTLQEKLTALNESNKPIFFSYDDEGADDETNHGDMSIQSIMSITEGTDEDLTWRLDPSESMSDWTLRIVTRGTKAIDEYHVHKNILAVGKRRSEYFVTLFRQHRKADPMKEKVTEIVMHHRAAIGIPMLLDYIYSSDYSLQLTAETATGMRFLSQYFGVRPLFEKVMKFILRDLSLKTLVTYYRDSRELDDTKIANLAAKHCARNVHLIDTSNELIQAMDPTFFAKVLSCPGLEERKLHISLLVTKYCQIHKDKMSSETFLEITKEENLPVIHHTAATSLLGMEADLVVITVAMMSTMTSLQQRCVKGLSAHWREITEHDREQITRVCRKLPSFVITELMLQSLEHAKKEHDQQVQNAALARKAQKTPKTKTTGATIQQESDNGTNQEVDATTRLKKEYETKLKHLQDVCYEKDKHIKNYFEELSRYKRIPNTHEGRLIHSGRKEQPTIMPKVGKHSTSGYLLAGRKLVGVKYPVFYYTDDNSKVQLESESKS